MAGAPVSSLCCDAVILLCNLFFIGKYVPHMLPSYSQGLSLVGVPTGAAILSITATKLLRALLGWQSVTPLHTVATVASTACLYGAGMLISLLLGKSLLSHKNKEINHEQADQRTA
jgi:hypothetical protein